MSTAVIETPSGKGAGDENFPVGSFLLPKRLRPHVAVFYRYARAIDDIADNPDLAADDKIARLDAFDRALQGRNDDPALETAHRMRESLAETGIDDKHCRDLISAFKQDAVKLRYDSWAELLDYCDRSAAPVGRYLLDLHGEDRADYVYSDALCNALQVINHLQDCKTDYRSLDRVYLPQDWLEDEGAAVEELDNAAASPGLRRVIDRAVTASEALLGEAHLLPKALKSRRLSLESAVIVHIADRLCRKLRKFDPVAQRVELTRPQFLICGVRGVFGSLF